MELVASANELRPRRYLHQRYQKEVLGTVQHGRHDEQQQMHKLAVTVLGELVPHARLNPTVRRIIEDNISRNTQWNMLVASQIMKHFEKYAWNLVDYPWKKEFLTIKTYSGFYKTHIEPHVCHAECLFGLLGYQLNNAEGHYEITGTPPPQESLSEMAFEFYIAGIECEICHAISCKADHVTTADVYQCRSRCMGTISTCVQRLQEKQNARSSWHSTSAHLTTSDYVEPLQLVTDFEYLAHIGSNRCCDTKSGSTVPVNNHTEDSETISKVFIQPFDIPATRHEHIVRSIQKCATNDRIQQRNNVAMMVDVTDGQHSSLREVLINEGLKDENHSHAALNTELRKTETVNDTKEIWACSSCTFINAVTTNICEMCFSSR